MNYNTTHTTIKQHVLLTVLNTFPMGLARRFCLLIKFFLSWHSLYLHYLNFSFSHNIVIIINILVTLRYQRVHRFVTSILSKRGKFLIKKLLCCNGGGCLKHNLVLSTELTQPIISICKAVCVSNSSQWHNQPKPSSPWLCSNFVLIFLLIN